MKFDFSRKFQKSLLSILIKDSESLLSYRESIKIEYFESQALLNICGALFDYYDTYKTLPKPATLVHKLHRDLRKYVKDAEIEKVTFELLKDLYLLEVTDKQYILDLVTNFCETQEWKDLVMDAPDFIEAGKFDELFERCLNAREKGRIVSPYIVTNQLEDRLDRLSLVVQGGLIKTGIAHFDNLFKVYPPSYGLIIADSERGKTWMLLDLARAALIQGYDVLYLTGEMSKDDLSIRFDAGLLGISFDYFLMPEIHDELKPKVKERYKLLKGEFVIQQFVASRYSVNDLDADIRRFAMRQDKPFLVCLDFIDLIKYKDGSKKGMAGWEEQIAVSQGIQGIVHSNPNLVVWAAGTMKTKREDSGALATRKDKSGAGDIVYTLDFYLTLNQSLKDSEYNRVMINVEKVKKAKGGWVIGVQTDFSKSRFCYKSLGAVKKSVLERQRNKNDGK